MKEFDPEAVYEETYLYEGSRLVKGSHQDFEMRRAWFVAMWHLLAWLQTADDSENNDSMLERLDRLAEKLDTFVVMYTSSEERVLKS